jgi:hypothetical protein
MRALFSRAMAIAAIAMMVGLSSHAAAQPPESKKKDIPGGPIAPATGEAAALALQLALEREHKDLLYRRELLIVRITVYSQRRGAYVESLAAYRSGQGPYGKQRDAARADLFDRLLAEAQYLQREHAALQAERAHIGTRLARVVADLELLRNRSPAPATKVAELQK